MNKQMTPQASAGRPSAWTGWVVFASFMLSIAGVFQFIAGLAALFREQVYLVGESQLVVLTYDQWGWTHMALGVLLILSAMALARGRTWGKIVGVMVAVLSMAANFVFIQAYPLWSIMIIMIDIAVIYSIVMHGSELREE